MAKKQDIPATEIEDKQPFITLASETLMGDLRDFLLDRLRHDHHALPWDMRGEQAHARPSIQWNPPAGTGCIAR